MIVSDRVYIVVIAICEFHEGPSHDRNLMHEQTLEGPKLGCPLTFFSFVPHFSGRY